MNKHCGNCGKLRSPLCVAPDECVPYGYKNWARMKPWKKCEKCGGKMYRVRTDPNQSETVIKTEVVCADCGWSGEDVREWIPKGFKKKGGDVMRVR